MVACKMDLRTENKIILYPKNRCRICLEATNGKIALNQTINYKKAEISLNELLEFCVNEQVCENGKADGLCLACMEKGIVCYEFKKKFVESQSILLKEIEEGNSFSFVIKTEDDLKEEDLVEITETEILKEEILNDDVSLLATENGVLAEKISDEQVLTENDELLNEEILEDDVLMVSTENGVLKEKISDEEIEEGNSFVLKTEEDLKEEDLLEITENEILKEEISHEEVLTENDEIVNEEILEDNVLLVATENGVLNEEISGEEAITENVDTLKEKSLDEKVQITETIKCHEDQQDILNTPGDKPTAISFKGKKGSLMRNKLEHSFLDQKNTPEYKCEVCEKTFKLRSDLVRHKLKHTQTGKQRNPCSYVQESSETSVQNMRNVFQQQILKNTDPPLPVTETDKPTPPPTTKSDKHTCEYCGKTLCNAYYLVIHMRTHTGEKSYSCKECGKSFAYPSALKMHQVVHTKQKDYLCKICGAAFGSGEYLKKHVQYMHSRNDRPRPSYKCTICKKTFTSLGGKNAHMDAHTGLRNHACELCGKQFNRYASLYFHRKIHTGERPHICKVCGKSFIQSPHLRQHMDRTHLTK